MSDKDDSSVTEIVPDDIDASDDVVVLGDLDIDFDGEEAPTDPGQDLYVDAYESADFKSSFVSLIADHHPTSVAERRGELVYRAYEDVVAGGKGCFPACTAQASAAKLMFEYDKVIVADNEAAAAELERQIGDMGGFSVRTLAQETASFRESLDRAEAWRPVKGNPDWDRLGTVIDPASRHCELPEEPCSGLTIADGVWSRQEAAPERVRLIASDRVKLVGDFDELRVDPETVADAYSLTAPGDADRISESIGMLHDAGFRRKLRKAVENRAHAVQPADEDDDDVDHPSPGDSPDAYDISVPESSPEKTLKKATAELAKMKKPAPVSSKKSPKPEVVRVYRSAKQFHADEAEELVLYGKEFDDTPRHLLKKALEMPGESVSLEDKIREASGTRISSQVVKSVAQGGKAVEVGQRVVLVSDGVEHVYMRAREESSGSYFWALQSSQPEGTTRPNCDKSDERESCYEAPPSDADILQFQRDGAEEVVARLKQAVGRGRDGSRIGVLRTFASMDGKYPGGNTEQMQASVSYVSSSSDEYVAEFRAAAEEAKEAASVASPTSYSSAAAAVMLLQIVRNLRLPSGIDAQWLVGLVADAAAEDNDVDGLPEEEGLASDARRLRFLLAAANSACAIGSMLTGDSVSVLLQRAREASISGMLTSSKAAAAWKNAGDKFLTPATVDSYAVSLRTRSPMLVHVVDLIESNDISVDEKRGADTSELDEWTGYRPRREFMRPATGASNANRTVGHCCEVAVKSGKQRESVSPLLVYKGASDATAARLSEGMKKAGIPPKNADRKTIEAALEGGSFEDVTALANAVVAIRRLAMLLSGKDRSKEILRPFKSVSPDLASEAVAALEGAMKRAAGATDMEGAASAWADAAEAVPVSLVSPLVSDTSARLRVSGTDVKALNERMERAKETIKLEKIAFVEAWSEEEQASLGELRFLGLQTINEQILEFDRMFQEEAPAGEEESYYDTMQDYDED